MHVTKLFGLHVDKLLLLDQILFNLLKEQVGGPSLHEKNLVHLLEEVLDAFWWLHSHAVALALRLDERDLALELFAALDDPGEGQVEDLRVLVEVDKVQRVEGAELVHDVPSVVLRN